MGGQDRRPSVQLLAGAQHVDEEIHTVHMDQVIAGPAPSGAARKYLAVPVEGRRMTSMPSDLAVVGQWLVCLEKVIKGSHIRVVAAFHQPPQRLET